MEQSILNRLLGPAQEKAEDWGKGHGPPLNLPPLRNQNVAAAIEARRSENLDTKLRRYLTDVASRSSCDREFGLQQLLNVLSSVSGSDAEICKFLAAQIFPETQVVPRLFQRTLLLDPPIPDLLDTTRVTVDPPSDREVMLALAVLGCCCLLHDHSRVLASDEKAVRVLLRALDIQSLMTVLYSLDALLAVLINSVDSKQDFVACNGVQRVAARVLDQRLDLPIRLKCVEFLMSLAAHSPLAGMDSDLTVILGKKAANSIMEVASSAYNEQMMHLIAERLVNSLI